MEFPAGVPLGLSNDNDVEEEGQEYAELDQLLGQLSAGGRRESRGHFSVDFHSARQKMAQYQLADPRHFLLKLVQAGIAAGVQSITVKAAPLTVEYIGWDMKLGIEVICDRLVALTEGAEDAASHLAVALNSLSVGQKAGVVLEFRAMNRNDGEMMALVDEELIRQKLHPGLALPYDSLVVRVRLRRSLKFNDLVKQRCSHAPIPIYLESERITSTPWIPETAGKSRSVYFQSNKIINEMVIEGPSTMSPPEADYTVTGPRTAWLLQSVDLRPKAILRLVKAGVVVDQKEVALGIPGLIATVGADDCDTDITSLQILDNQKLRSLVADLEPYLDTFLARSIAACSRLETEGQPMRADKPIKTSTTVKTLGATFLCITTGTVMLLHGNVLGVSFLMGSLVPAGITAVTSAVREGCAPDDASELEAQQQLRLCFEQARKERSMLRPAFDPES